MATSDLQNGTTANAGDADMTADSAPQAKINRMKALSSRSLHAEMMAALPVVHAAGITLRRPGMAARWKGMHRLAISG
jgi:hypothetical protein